MRKVKRDAYCKFVVESNVEAMISKLTPVNLFFCVVIYFSLVSILRSNIYRVSIYNNFVHV